MCPVCLTMILLKDEKTGQITYPWRTEIVFDLVILQHRLFLTLVLTTIKLTSIFLQLFEWLSLTSQFAALCHWTWQFLNTEISQGSVAKRLRCGGMFNDDFIANLLLSLPVKEFWKLVSIWPSYGQKSSVLFFGSQCSIITHSLA